MMFKKKIKPPKKTLDELIKNKSVLKGDELLKEQETQNKLLKKSEDHKQKNLEKK